MKSETLFSFRMGVLVCLICLFIAGTRRAEAQSSTAFVYQGRLTDSGDPANGTYTLRFGLFDAASGGNQLGATITNSAVSITNGVFAVSLDFGAGPFNGKDRFLEVTVGGVVLAPRTRVAPAPMAIYAASAESAANITGVLPSSGLVGTYKGAVVLNNTTNLLTGSFTGNGAAVSNVNAATVGGMAAGSLWQLNGNNGSVAGSNFLGTTDNQALIFKVNGVQGLRIEPAVTPIVGVPNLIGGLLNSVQTGESGNVIAGGFGSSIRSSASSIGGGTTNQIGANANHSVIAGGWENTIGDGAHEATISGGQKNKINSGGTWSLIGGGYLNTIQANNTMGTIAGGGANTIGVGVAQGTISGGVMNRIGDVSDNSTVSGGIENVILTNSPYSTIAGGAGNKISDNTYFGTISGGAENYISESSQYSGIGGGYHNRIDEYGAVSTIGGGQLNFIGQSSSATISGGESSLIENNSWNATVGGGYGHAIWTFAPYSTVGGGNGNTISNFSRTVTIGGGAYNRVGMGSTNAVIGGGTNNVIEDLAMSSTIAGGQQNRIGIQAGLSSIGGGFQNWIDAVQSTIGGGNGNHIEAGSEFSMIGGGVENRVQQSSPFSTVGGGVQNTIFSGSQFSTIGGGLNNAIETAPYATIPGGDRNLAVGESSFAAGRRAHAMHAGSFVWADGTEADFESSRTNQFAIRASGGVVLSDSTPSISFGTTNRQMLNLKGLLYGIGTQNGAEYFRTGVGQDFYWFGGGAHSNTNGDAGPGGTVMMKLGTNGLTVNGTFVSTSDKFAKTNFVAVSPAEVLAKVAGLPILSWSYTNSMGSRHIGPMAQDFHAAFGTGEDERHIASVDEGGVALAAIQGLNAKVEEKDREIKELRKRLAELEAIVNGLAGREQKSGVRSQKSE